MTRFCGLVAGVACAIMPLTGAYGAMLNIPETIIYANSSSATVPFTVVTALGINDTISVEGIGMVELARYNGVDRYSVNAAGVVVQPATTHLNTHPGSVTANSQNGFPYGAVLIGNSSLGYHPLFIADASTGLGGAAGFIPTDIFSYHTIGEIFGKNIAAGTQLSLQLVVNDSNYGDNVGSFTVKSFTPNGPNVPDAGTTLSLLGVGLIGLAGLRRKIG